MGFKPKNFVFRPVSNQNGAGNSKKIVNNSQTKINIGVNGASTSKSHGKQVCTSNVFSVLSNDSFGDVE